jgi:hypothetical protein
MTTAQKHAARLREMAYAILNDCQDRRGIKQAFNDCDEDVIEEEIIPAWMAIIEAGAEALEAQGEWRISKGPTRDYFIPVERWDEWLAWCMSRETGEYTAIVPDWAVAVPDDVIVTGWRKQ